MLAADRDTTQHWRAVRGRVVVVTGASEGIGAAVARDCGAAGATVVLVARTRQRLDAVRDEIVAGGGQAAVHPADLSDTAEVERVCAEILDAHGAVDVLVNNAGRSIRRAVTDSIDRFHDVDGAFTTHAGLRALTPSNGTRCTQVTPTAASASPSRRRSRPRSVRGRPRRGSGGRRG